MKSKNKAGVICCLFALLCLIASSLCYGLSETISSGDMGVAEHSLYMISTCFHVAFFLGMFACILAAGSCFFE